MEQLTVRVKLLRPLVPPGSVVENYPCYIVECDEDPTLVEACGADQYYNNPNAALGHFLFQASCLMDFTKGVKLDIRLE